MMLLTSTQRLSQVGSVEERTRPRRPARSVRKPSFRLLVDFLLLCAGYHDVNFARVTAAKKYQSTCDEIFVVTDIKRGVDDSIIKDVVNEHKGVAEGVGKVAFPNITVVCTHAAVSSCLQRHECDIGYFQNNSREWSLLHTYLCSMLTIHQDLGSFRDKQRLKALVPASKIIHAEAQIKKVEKRHGSFLDAKKAIREAEIK